jgi:molybdate/tungstate transport system ATP-binding protein
MIEVSALGAHAGTFALQDVSFTLPRGAWGIVLGPAGAGKTTLLETIAGVRRASAGRVLLRGEDVTSLPPERRRLGIVYQHGYLFPHLSVEENVCYGATDRAHAVTVSDRLGAAALFGRTVEHLSGGERQVVALARALAPRPDILLLDEPFAALDPRRRTRVRRELHAMQRELGFTVLQVTHDFGEAGTLGDLALLVEAGRLVQVAPPAQLFRQPATAAAAEFLGAENVYAGIAETIERGGESGPDTVRFRAGTLSLVGVGTYEGERRHAVIRGEDVVLARARPGPSSARNVLDGVVMEIAAEGSLARVTLDVAGVPLVASLTTGSVAELGLQQGVAVVATVKATAVHLC